jgi:hypothetical protein
MKTVVHKASSRGHADYGWLSTYYSFSFAHYYNPDMMHFGALRVLNDDTIDGGHGFDRHPHDNMEIITIPLEGEIRHRDSMGNTFVIRKNDVQAMSAGTGIFHSEFNNRADSSLKLLQIWIFPQEQNLAPRYDQLTFDPSGRMEKWQLLVAPNESEAVQIMQQAYVSRAHLPEGKELDYSVYNKGNGMYLFLIEGSIRLEQQVLECRDGLSIEGAASIRIQAMKDAEILLLEVPMI